MPIEPTPAASSSDDFDRQLRDITSGAAGAARFRELSAEERARLAGSGGPKLPRTLRKRLAARKARKPASGPPRKRTTAARKGRRLRVVGGRSYRPADGSRHQRLIAVARAVGILVAFVALLLILHLLGFGPQ